jgi:hypothetical protein
MKHLLRGHRLLVQLLFLFVSVASSQAMAQKSPYAAIWSNYQANGDVRILMELDESDTALFANAKASDPYVVQLQTNNDIVTTDTNPFNARFFKCKPTVGCFFDGPFLPLRTYKMIVAEDVEIEFKVACQPGGNDITSLDSESCVPKQAFFQRRDPQHGPSSLSIESVGSGQFRVFLDPLSNLNLEAVFAPNSSGFALASSNADIKFDIYSFYDLPSINSAVGETSPYPIVFSLESGFSTVQGLNVIEFKLKPSFTIGIPYSEVPIIEFHKLTGTARDRYPALFSLSYEYKPTVVNNDLFYVTKPAHSVQLGLLYNFPLAQSLDLDLKWDVAWDLLDAFRFDAPTINTIDFSFNWYFSGKFDAKNYLKTELILNPNASLLDPALEVRISLLTTMKSLTDLLSASSK